MAATHMCARRRGKSQYGTAIGPEARWVATDRSGYAAISRVTRSSVLVSVSTAFTTLSIPLMALRIGAEAT